LNFPLALCLVCCDALLELCDALLELVALACRFQPQCLGLRLRLEVRSASGFEFIADRHGVRSTFLASDAFLRRNSFGARAQRPLFKLPLVMA
jgi:hypothetical protein